MDIDNGGWLDAWEKRIAELLQALEGHTTASLTDAEQTLAQALWNVYWW